MGFLARLFVSLAVVAAAASIASSQKPAVFHYTPILDLNDRESREKFLEAHIESRPEERMIALSSRDRDNLFSELDETARVPSAIQSDAREGVFGNEIATYSLGTLKQPTKIAAPQDDGVFWHGSTITLLPDPFALVVFAIGVFVIWRILRPRR